MVKDTQPIFWSFKPKDIFERYDLYVFRLNEIKEIFQTVIEFNKLEKVEIGGLKGRSISRYIQTVADEFARLYNQWTNISFDPLDPDPTSKEFANEKRKFFAAASILERRLAQQLVAAFEECQNLEQGVKLLQVLGTLTVRPIIYNEIKDLIPKIVDYFKQDLEMIKVAFDTGMAGYERDGLNGLPIDRGWPPFSGAITWIRKLRDRITKANIDFGFLEVQ